ncbi:MAG TPA: AzlC family ABC transporter permease [Candidatus Rifleibacterium sp.]|nr:AzlC family ABC transporter permease [Candidatus Rifleibacterium sp.]
MKQSFFSGLRDGIPICLGYIVVSMSFGMFAVARGIPVSTAIALSMTNMTSAGQFAAVNLAGACATFTEIGLATAVVNIRYALMSLVLSQKIEKMSFFKRMLLAAGITDEVFTLASTRGQKVGFSYMAGLIVTPYIGWSLGTILGATVNSLMPVSVVSAMGITLYGMFVAIVVPVAREERPVLMTLLIAISLSCLFKYTPALAARSAGRTIIVVTLITASLAACLFTPVETAKSVEVAK